MPYHTIASQVAERLAAGRDRGDPLAPRTEEVVVASAGVAQAIAAAMLQHFPSGVAALQLQTIDTLARRIVNAAGEFPRIATDEERRLAMRTAARAIDDPLTSTRGAAAMLERSYRDVRDSGITLAEFSSRASKARLRNGDRIRTVIKVWHIYERFIDRLDAVDPAPPAGRGALQDLSQELDPLVEIGALERVDPQGLEEAPRGVQVLLLRRRPAQE